MVKADENFRSSRVFAEEDSGHSSSNRSCVSRYRSRCSSNHPGNHHLHHNHFDCDARWSHSDIDLNCNHLQSHSHNYAHRHRDRHASDLFNDHDRFGIHNSDHLDNHDQRRDDHSDGGSSSRKHDYNTNMHSTWRSDFLQLISATARAVRKCTF